MLSSTLLRKIDRIQVKSDLKDVLREMVTAIEDSRAQAVTKTDFSDLKEIVRDLAEAQKRTEIKVEELAEAQKRTEIKVEELAEAQKRTEVKVEELAEAQKRTEAKVEELAEAQKRTEIKMEELTEVQKATSQDVAALTHAMEDMRRELTGKIEEARAQLTGKIDGVRSQVGGLARSVAYDLENEAYRELPAYLNTRHQIEILDRLVRTEIGAKEINFFAHARQNGRDMLLVGETVLKLDDRSKLRQLEENVTIAEQTYQLPVIPLIVTHFARPEVLADVQQSGIIVVQTFEWK